ncbi:MAG: hypothetical protein HY939_05350, partial [Gammaproteobacteria bacterium]|nr:hypothetical protein [Gammaproteobacteria bacterium]
ADTLRLCAWQAAQHHHLNVTNYTPSDNEKKHLERIDKVLGSAPPSDAQTPS